MHFLYLRKRLHECMWMQESRSALFFTMQTKHWTVLRKSNVVILDNESEEGDAPAPTDMVDEQLECEDIEFYKREQKSFEWKDERGLHKKSLNCFISRFLMTYPTDRGSNIGLLGFSCGWREPILSPVVRTRVLIMGRTRKRSRFPSDERASSFPRTATVRDRHWERLEHINRGSRMRNDRKIITPTIAANPNIHQVRNRIASVVVRPWNRIAERYDSRNERIFLTSKMRNAKKNTTPANAYNPNTQQVRRRIPSVVVRPMNQIVVWTEHGIRFSRVMSARNDTLSSITQDSHTQRISSISYSMEGRYQSEISEGYGRRNEHGHRVSRVRYRRSDTPTATEQYANTTQAPGTNASVEGRPLSEIADEYELRCAHGFRGSRIRNVRNTSPTAIAQDLNSHQEPSTYAYVESRLLSETQEEYESCTELEIRFSRLRNEINDTIAQDPNTQHTTSISASMESRPLSETVEGYDCSICLDTRHRREMRYLPCLHKFHKRCINKWLNENEICPICRLSTEDVRYTSRN
ncbi:hypothetical protein AVEN_74902-1 [Araneus ventricosus]|uniref:RING-type E3 ubiquitin transferase n=1 Tax=Araneus ventricosus TaxID=182803 RepID=A0A4Y2MB47_ARAVE|nr:hypothetical protein AVEN_74902-1 [Araneus ventricosus]